MPSAVKSTLMFQDQVNVVTTWFKTWNDCEQTVALYSLLRKISARQAKFLSQVLEQSLKDATDLHILEMQANNTVFISNLCNEAKDTAVTEVLQRLPLLNPGNTEAKLEYMKLIPKILAHSIEHGMHIEESRQLLSYSLIHPAMSGEERQRLSVWLNHLEERFSEAKSVSSSAEELLPSPCSPHSPRAMDSYSMLSGTDVKGKSLYPVPPGGWSHRLPPGEVDESGSFVANGVKVKIESLDGAGGENLRQLVPSHLPVQATLSGPPKMSTSPGASQLPENMNTLHKPLMRSYSVTPPSTVSDWLTESRPQQERHAQLSPQSSVASSGSGSDLHQEESQGKNTFIEDGSGMKEVPGWLKSLRLHKYASLFQQLTYEEMLNLSEDWLESKNVTKGARHKIVLSIQKLRERQNTLKMLEKDIMEKEDLKLALTEMRNIINTPIKAYKPKAEGTEKEAGSNDNEVAEDDLPGQFTRVMGKVCTQLLVSSRPDDECFNIYLQLLDRCVGHEAFTQKQKNLLLTWKQSVQRIWHPQTQRAALEKRKSWGNTFPLNVPKGHIQGRPVRGVGNKAGGVQWTFNKRPLQALSSGGSIPMYSTMPPTFIGQQAQLEPKQMVHRTHSAPMRAPQFSGLAAGPKPGNESSATEPEINARLDDLCLSMTAAALGGPVENPDRGGTY